MPKQVAKVRTALALPLLAIILASLAASIPNTAAVMSNNGAPLLLYMFKFRRGMEWEGVWANSSPVTYYEGGRWVPLNLPHRYIIKPLPPLTNAVPLPEGVGSGHWFLHSVGEGALPPSPDLLELAQSEVPQMCHLMSGYFGALYREAIDENVSEDFRDYIVWFGNSTVIHEFPGLNTSIYYLYPFDYVPPYIYRGDTYLSWCLSTSAITPPTLANYAKREYPPFRYLSYASASPAGSGSAAFLEIADYLSLTGSEHPLSEAAKNYLVNLGSWSGLSEEALKELLKYHVLFDAYIPIYEESKARELVQIIYPRDESFIFTLYPSEWWDSIEGFVPMSPFTYYDLSPTGFVEAELEGADAVNISDYQIIHTLYYGDHPATQAGKVYNVTVWVYGPGYLIHASPSPFIGEYMPTNLNYVYTRPAFTYLMREVERNITLARSSPLHSVAMSIANNTIPIPSNYTALLGSPFYWIVPDSGPTKVFRGVFDSSRPVESMRSFTFIFYIDYDEWVTWQVNPIIFIKISDGERSWVRRVRVSPSGYVYRFSRNTDKWDYGDSFPFHGLVKDGLDVVASVEGEIGLERHYNVSIEPQLSGFVYGATVYDFIVKQVITDRVWVLAHSTDYPSGKTYNIPYIGDDPDPGSDWWFGYFNTPVEMRRELRVRSVQRVILGGTSPFPNYGAVPYWVPSFPSPLLPPAKSPTPEGLLKLTGFPRNPPLPQELVGEFARLLGNVAQYHLYDGLYNYLKYVFAGDLLNYAFYGTKPKEGTVEGVYWVHDLLEPDPASRAWVSYAPALIEEVTITSITQLGPIPPYVRLWQRSSKDISRLPPDLAYLKTGFWHTISVSVIASDVAGSATFYDLRTHASDFSYNIAVFTQYPTARLYNLTTPYPTGRTTSIVINSSEYGWSDPAPDQVFWPSGFTWFKRTIPYWGLGAGLRGVAYISGASYASFTPGNRFGVVDGYFEWVGDRIESSRVDTLVCKGCSANYNPYWVPLGDGVQEIPVFYQVMAPLIKHYETSPVLGISVNPIRALSPGDKLVVTASFYGDEPPGRTVELRIVTKGLPSPFEEGDAVEIHLSRTEVRGLVLWEGNVTLHVLNASRMAEAFGGYGHSWVDVELHGTLGPYHGMFVVRVFVSGKVSIQLLDYGARDVVPAPSGAPGQIPPPGKMFRFPIVFGLSQYERLISRAVMVLENGTFTYTREFNVTYKGFSEGVYSASDVPPGTYNLSLILFIRYGPPTMEDLYRGNYTDYWEFERSVLRRTPNYLREAEVRLRIGEVKVGDGGEAFTVIFPFTRLSELMGALETLAGRYVIEIGNGGRGLVLYVPRNPLKPLGGSSPSLPPWSDEELARVAELLGYGELADIVRYAYSRGSFREAMNDTGLPAATLGGLWAHYEPGLSGAAQELEGLLEGGIKAWVVGEGPAEDVLYTYEALDTLHSLLVTAPESIASWGYFLGYYTALATFTVAGMYDFQAMYGTADAAIPESVFKEFLSKLGVSWAGEVNALLPLTSLPSTPQAALSRDVRYFADYVLYPHYGSSLNLTYLMGAWVDVLTAWLWNVLHTEHLHSHPKGIFYIASVASASVLTEAYIRGVRGAVPNIVHSIATGSRARKELFREFHHLMKESGAAWRPPLKEFENHMFRGRGVKRIFDMLPRNLASALLPQETPTPLNSVPEGYIGSGSMTGLTYYLGGPWEPDPGDRAVVAWIYTPYMIRTMAVVAYSVSSMNIQLGLDAASSTALTAAATAGLMIAQASPWVIEESGHLPVAEWAGKEPTLMFSRFYTSTPYYLAQMNYYEDLLRRVADLARSGHGGVAGELLWEAYDAMMAGKLLYSIQYPSPKKSIVNGFGHHLNASPVMGPLSVYSSLVRLGRVVHAFIGAVAEMGVDNSTSPLVDPDDVVGRAFMMSKAYAAGADALVADYGRWLSALMAGDIVDERYHKYLAAQALVLYAEALLDAVSAYDELAKLYPSPDDVLEKHSGWPPIRYGRDDTMYPLLLLGSASGDTISLSQAGGLLIISPGAETACGTDYPVAALVSGGGWVMNSTEIGDHSCYYAVAEPAPSTGEAKVMVSGEEPVKPEAHIAILAGVGSPDPFVAAGYYAPSIRRDSEVMSAGQGTYLVTFTYPNMTLKLDIRANSSEKQNIGVLEIDVDLTIKNINASEAVYGFIAWLPKQVIESLKKDGLVPDLTSAELRVKSWPSEGLRVAASLIPYGGGAMVVVGVRTETLDVSTLEEIIKTAGLSIYIDVPFVKSKSASTKAVVSGSGESIEVEGLGTVKASSNGTSTLTISPGNKLVKIRVSGSPTKLLIPAEQGVNVTVIVEGEEIPLETEKVIQDGQTYYSVTLPPGEAIIYYGGPWTSTTTTTSATTTTATTTTSTTAATTTTSPTPPAATAGTQPWVLGAVAAATVAVALAVIWVWRRRK